jgi:hypothetical protein
LHVAHGHFTAVLQYGDGLADSGDPGSAITRDDVSMFAKYGPFIMGCLGVALYEGCLLTVAMTTNVACGACNSLCMSDAIVCRVQAIGPGYIELDRELPFPINPDWTATVHKYAPSIQDAGVENLTIAFA